MISGHRYIRISLAARLESLEFFLIKLLITHFFRFNLDDEKHFNTFIEILKNPESYKELRSIISRACLTLIDEKEERVMKNMLDKFSISNFPMHVVLEEISSRFPSDTKMLATKFLLHCVIEISKFKEFGHFGRYLIYCICVQTLLLGLSRWWTITKPFCYYNFLKLTGTSKVRVNKLLELLTIFQKH